MSHRPYQEEEELRQEYEHRREIELEREWEEAQWEQTVEEQEKDGSK